MYNQEIKERFLSEYEGGRKVSASTNFESIGKYEELCGKDFAEMSECEAIEALKYVRIKTYGTAFGVLSFVRNYVKWCRENSVFDNLNSSLVSLTVDDIDISDELKSMLFTSEDELIKAMRSVRPFDDGYYDVIVVLFGWLGIPQKQVTSIKIDHVNLSENFLVFEDTEIKFSDSIRDILSLYAKTKTGTRVQADTVRIVYRDDSYDTFVRKFSAPKQLGKKLTNSQVEDAVYLLNKAYVEQGNDPKFTSGSIMHSGGLRRVYDLEKQGIDVFSIKNKNAVLQAYRVKAKLYEILWLYKNYKKAFNL